MDDHKISELIDLLDISSDARVIDIGCGKAEYLIKLTKKIKLQAIGVDLHHMPLKRDERE